MKTVELPTKVLERLIGQKCWGFVAGSGTGSILSLQFGNMIPRPQPLPNERLMNAVRMNEAELSLFIECTWRLDGASTIITGCWDSNEEAGPMLTGLTQLIDQRVLAVTCKQPGYDTMIQFTNEIELRIFCDKTNVIDMEDNFSLSTTTSTVIVGCRGAVRFEQRQIT